MNNVPRTMNTVPRTNHLSCLSHRVLSRTSTTVEMPLQIDLFMQNKPNFQKSQMNANLYNTTDYENKWQRRVRKNKPNSNPIQIGRQRSDVCFLSSVFCLRSSVFCPLFSGWLSSRRSGAAQQINKFDLTPKVGKSIIAGETCDSIQYIMSDI